MISEPSKKLLTYHRPISSYFHYTTRIFGIVLIPCTVVYIFYPSIVTFTLVGVSFILSIPFWIFLMFESFRSRRIVCGIINQQHPKDLESSSDIHHALIFNCSFSEPTDFDYSGVGQLIRSFYKKDIHFRIYRCFNPSEFTSVLMNPSAHFLWIFGHGWQGGITFKYYKTLIDYFLGTSKRTNAAYNELCVPISSFPKKEFIGQFHCNHIPSGYSSTSLPEILCENLDETHYFITDRENNGWSIYFGIRKILKTRDLRTMCLKTKIY